MQCRPDAVRYIAPGAACLESIEPVRDFDRQVAEVQIGAAILNRFTAL